MVADRLQAVARAAARSPPRRRGACRSRRSTGRFAAIGERRATAACACAPSTPCRRAARRRTTGSAGRSPSAPRTGRAGRAAPRISSATCSVAVAVQAITVGRAEPVDHAAQPQVVGAEVVAPLGHAVGLVDGEQVDLARARSAARNDAEAKRSGEQKTIRASPVADASQRRRDGVVVHPRGDHRRRVAAEQQAAVLVRHQRDQRRDHHRQVRARRSRGAGSRGSCRRPSASRPGCRGRRARPARPRAGRAGTRRARSARAARPGRAARRRPLAAARRPSIRSRPFSASWASRSSRPACAAASAEAASAAPRARVRRASATARGAPASSARRRPCDRPRCARRARGPCERKSFMPRQPTRRLGPHRTATATQPPPQRLISVD